MKSILGMVISFFLFFPMHVFGDEGEAAYLKAKECYTKLQMVSSSERHRDRWKECIHLFSFVREAAPTSPKVPEAVYSVGRLSRELFMEKGDQEDLTASIVAYNKMVSDFPSSPLADDALYQIALLRHDPLKEDDRARTALEELLKRYPKSDRADEARALLAELDKKEKPAAKKKTKAVDEKNVGATAREARFDPPPPARFGGPTAHIIDIKTEQQGDRTIVRLLLDQPVPFTTSFEPFGKRTKSPAILKVDLSKTERTHQLPEKTSFQQSPLLDMRFQKNIFTGGLVVRFEMNRNVQFETSTERNDILISFFRSSKTSAPPEKQQQKQKPMHIIIDPGHGGDDTGAIGKSGSTEKDVVLAISKKLAQELERELGAKVFLTRKRDVALTLEERNLLAVKRNADLFLSIHANASPKESVAGIQTYYLNNASDAASAKLANRENKTSGRPLSEVEHVLSTMLQNSTTEESARLAKNIQGSVVSRMKKHYSGVHDLKVQSALFYVLVGAKCPGVLVETSFISNPLEEKRLSLGAYQQHLAKGIADGVVSFLREQESKRSNL